MLSQSELKTSALILDVFFASIIVNILTTKMLWVKPLKLI